MITKDEFMDEVKSFDQSKVERWKFLSTAYTKSLKLKPYKKGIFMRGLMRSAVVTVPIGLTSQLCKEDLAMVVAGGPHYGSFRIKKKSSSDIIDITEGDPEFIVTVILDIGDDHVLVKDGVKAVEAT